MLPVPIQIAVTNDGRKYIVKTVVQRVIGRRLEPHTVLCFGEVLSVSGYSTRHGPDKKFLVRSVTVLDAERTPDVLEELRVQGEKEKTWSGS